MSPMEEEDCSKLEEVGRLRKEFSRCCKCSASLKNRQSLLT